MKSYSTKTRSGAVTRSLSKLPRNEKGETLVDHRNGHPCDPRGRHTKKMPTTSSFFCESRVVCCVLCAVSCVRPFIARVECVEGLRKNSDCFRPFSYVCDMRSVCDLPGVFSPSLKEDMRVVCIYEG